MPADCGPLLAAGPTLIAALERVAALTDPGTPAHEIAANAIESFREREAMTLVDWHSRVPRLRIVGVAS